MKTNIILLVISILCLTNNSCELESKVYDSINASTYPKTENDVDALVTEAAYGAFRNDAYDGIFNVANGINILSDLTSDYSECTWRDRSPLLYGRWTFPWQMARIYGYSNWISKMELTADRIKDVSMDANKLAQYQAELKCGQGWMAFLLYDAFGPIVIADLETLKDPLQNKILPRLSDEEMQTYIETRLKEAASVLPYSYKKGDANYGRFTRGLANMVLLKFYMKTKQWQKAEAMGRELMDTKYGYSLVPNYKDIFTLANEKNAETIWSINCVKGYQEQYWQPHVLPSDYPSVPLNITKWGGWKISWPFFHTYDKKDKRLDVICSEYTGTTGLIHNEDNDIKTNGNLKYGALPIKYEIDPNTVGEKSTIDWIIYRYADALTLLSEAIVRNHNVVTQEAVDLLNKIRTRAGLDAYSLNDFKSVDDFLDKLLLERGHEFFYEGCRRQDLIRHGKYVEYMKEKCETLGESTLINKNMELWPLPQNVIDEGKGAIVQNPGY
jgi:hypothetical protein